MDLRYILEKKQQNLLMDKMWWEAGVAERSNNDSSGSGSSNKDMGKFSAMGDSGRKPGLCCESKTIRVQMIFKQWKQMGSPREGIWTEEGRGHGTNTKGFNIYNRE